MAPPLVLLGDDTTWVAVRGAWWERARPWSAAMRRARRLGRRARRADGPDGLDFLLLDDLVAGLVAVVAVLLLIFVVGPALWLLALLALDLVLAVFSRVVARFHRGTYQVEAAGPGGMRAAVEVRGRDQAVAAAEAAHLALLAGSDVFGALGVRPGTAPPRRGRFSPPAGPVLGTGAPTGPAVLGTQPPGPPPGPSGALGPGPYQAPPTG